MTTALQLTQNAIKRLTAETVGQLSDGYHTFDELYDHRATLYIALCEQLHQKMDGMNADYVYDRQDIWRCKKHSDGSIMEGWFLLGINQAKGKQITYHLPDSRWNDCDFATTLANAPEFDGHAATDVLTRLKEL